MRHEQAVKLFLAACALQVTKDLEPTKEVLQNQLELVSQYLLFLSQNPGLNECLPGAGCGWLCIFAATCLRVKDTVLFGGDSFMLPEFAGKVGGVCVTALFADFFDRKFGIRQ